MTTAVCVVFPILDMDLSWSHCLRITKVSSGINTKEGNPILLPWISLQIPLSDYIEPAFECKRSWWQYPTAAATCLFWGSDPRLHLPFRIWQHVLSQEVFRPGLQMPASEHLKTSEQQSLIAALDPPTSLEESYRLWHCNALIYKFYQHRHV